MHHAITFAYKYVTRCVGDEVHILHVEPMAEACSPPCIHQYIQEIQMRQAGSACAIANLSIGAA